MLSRYHIEITKNSLETFFTSATLGEVARANVAQDSLPSIFGMEARRHVCDCTVDESFAYIDEEHAQIAELAQQPGRESQQRAALGRLLHTVQDFYAHTNYVALWIAERWQSDTDEMGRVVAKFVANKSVASPLVANEVALMDGLDPLILAHPALTIAQWQTWRDPLYYIPVMGKVLRRFWLPPTSHEAINLDSPKCGDYFPVAMAIARQRTLVEYARAVAAIRAVGGRMAVARFHGAEGYAPRVAPLEA